MKKKIKDYGNSKVITFSKEEVEANDLKTGDIVEVITEKDKKQLPTMPMGLNPQQIVQDIINNTLGDQSPSKEENDAQEGL